MPVTLSHSTELKLSLLIRKPIGRSAIMSLPWIVMLTATVGAVALTVAALPSFDRFFRW